MTFSWKELWEIALSFRDVNVCSYRIAVYLDLFDKFLALVQSNEIFLGKPPGTI